MQLPILKYIKLTITLIACSLASAQLFATSGSCGDPASLERLPPSKRALVEQRCNDRATRAVKEENFHLEKQAWAAIYFAEKPAVRKVYNDKANMVNGCPGGFDDTNCDLDDLVTVFYKTTVTSADITWIDRASSGGSGYVCERYDSSEDGSDLLD